MDISIVIPAFNEADNLAFVLDEIQRVLDGEVDYEIVYVDDGSTDDTVSRLASYGDHGAQCLRIRRHRRRYGQTSAISTGVRAARAGLIVTLDADGQNDAADIPRLLEVFHAPERDARLQLVTGFRRRRQDNGLKRLSSKVANSVRAWLLNDGTPDTGCGLKVFPRQAYLELPQFDHMHRFLPALFRRQGGLVETVEVNHRPRQRGASKYGIHNRLWVGIVDLLGVMWLLRRYQRPDCVEDQQCQHPM